MEFVADRRQLGRFLDSLAGARTLAVDTEFVREGTYRPRLALIQIAADSERVAVIDPFTASPLDDLFAVLGDEAVVKVMHAAEQDLEILLDRMGAPPAPLFDTQVAAAFLGYGERVSLANLLDAELGVSLDKTETYTNWLRRPLAPAQVAYAAADVQHLPALADRLTAKLAERGRLPWAEEEFARCRERVGRPDPATLYRRVRRASTLERRELAVLRELAAWRELEADVNDRPRQGIATDECLLELARRQPLRPETLVDARGLGRSYQRAGAAGPIAAIKRGRAVPEASLPEAIETREEDPALRLAADITAALVRERGLAAGVAPGYLATASDLTRLLAIVLHGDPPPPDVPLLGGWRRELAGDAVMSFIAGRLACVMEGGAVRFVPRSMT